MNWKPVLKGLAGGVLALIVLLLAIVAYQLFAFGRAAEASYDVAPLDLVASTDSTVIARGEHIAASFGGCFACHGTDLSGRLIEDLGPIGKMIGPNLTNGAGGIGRDYSDGELARAIRYGIGRDNQTLMFMPTPEHAWWPDSDLLAVVSYLRTVPPVAKTLEATTIGPLGKVLSQFGMMELQSARAAEDAPPRDSAPAPEPTAAYGEFLAIGCIGCHGEGFSGGRIPGAPASLPIPSNLTPHETGLAAWSREDFDSVISTGIGLDGRTLDPFMPLAGIAGLNETEKQAIWAYLQSLEPKEFGGR